MIVVVSPTKRMNETKSGIECSKPLFVSKTKQIMDVLKSMDVETIMKAFKVKENIAVQNYERYQTFKYDTKGNAALMSYQGIQYQYMKLDMDESDWEYASEHMRILDALYGVLHPTTSVYPYRLDMLAKVKVNDENLYQFWGNSVYKQIMKELKHHEEHKIICLASKEYAELLIPFAKDELVMINFYVIKEGKYKMEATAAKMARGRLMGYLLNNKIDSVEEIKSFDEDGWIYDNERSDANNLCFCKLVS